MQQVGSSGRFLVDMGFEVPPDRYNEMLSLVPQEQAHVAELRGRGIVETIYISADRSHVWLIMHGPSRQAVEQALTDFPLHPFMRPTITELAPD